MDDSRSLNNSKLSEEYSYSKAPENDDLTMLKVEVFHLRLRCYNLEQDLANCRCSTENEEKKDFFDHRTQLGQVVNSHQELKWENERLAEDNRILKERCGSFNEDYEKKRSSYEGLKMKYEQLKLIVERDGSIHSGVQQIMKDNDLLIQTNVERKIKIMQLEKKLADVNKSFVEEESQRRKSLTQSLVKVFKPSTDCSFQNTKSCVQCDELKVYTDQLSETVIKMTIDYQGSTKTLEQQNAKVAELESEILRLKSTPNINEEQVVKYKVCVKQCVRKYMQEKESKLEQKKEFDELMEFQMKMQGDLQREIRDLKKQLKTDKIKVVEEASTIGKLFVKKLNEVQEANDQMTSIMRSLHTSHGSLADYDQVGQYSPQYKIRTDCPGNSSVMSDSDSVYFDKNVSLNTTLFKTKFDESSFMEADIAEVLSKMQQKVRELGEVVHGYLTKMKDEHNVSSASKENKRSLTASFGACSANASVWTCENNETSESDNRDENYLKQIYEEEKQRFDNILEEKVLKIEELTNEVEFLRQDREELHKVHQTKMDAMSVQYKDAVEKYHKKISQLKEDMQCLELTNQDRHYKILNLSKDNEELSDQVSSFTNKINDLEAEVLRLNTELYQYGDAIKILNSTIQMKIEDNHLVFMKLKSIIDSYPLLFPVENDNVSPLDQTNILRMICLMEDIVAEKSNTVETMSRGNSIPNLNTTEEVLVDNQCPGPLAESIVESENRFYTSSLNLRGGPNSMGQNSEAHLNDLTNVTDLNADNLSEAASIDSVNPKDRFKFIRENPEKIHQKLKYFYETCEMYKKVALQKHEENKRLKQSMSSSVYQAIDEMTKQIDDFKRQLDLCKECLVRSKNSLPDAVARELKDLNLL